MRNQDGLRDFMQASWNNPQPIFYQEVVQGYGMLCVSLFNQIKKKKKIFFFIKSELN